jgi:osmotically-inducible protein OsmY
MRVRSAILAGLLACGVFSLAHAQQQSQTPADTALSEKIHTALGKAGIDFNATPVQVVVAADHTVYLKGGLGNPQQIRLATKVAEQNAPGYRVVNQIKGGFFADPNHVIGGQDK